jgi:hypothetical protein
VIPLKTSSNIIEAIEIVLIPSFISCLYQKKYFDSRFAGNINGFFLLKISLWTSNLDSLRDKIFKMLWKPVDTYNFSSKSREGWQPILHKLWFFVWTIVHFNPHARRFACENVMVKWHDGENAIVCKILFKNFVSVNL